MSYGKVDLEFNCIQVPDNLDTIFAPIWNQDREKDILYVCMGSSFNDQEALHIYHIANVSKERGHHMQLTTSGNNAFPSTNRDGTRLSASGSYFYIWYLMLYVQVLGSTLQISLVNT